MGKYTITISDEPSAVRVVMDGAMQEKTAAFLVADVLMRLAPEIISRAASRQRNCPCSKCEAKRNSAAQTPSTDSKPTLH